MVTQGKTTYLARYENYIHVIDGSDTIVFSNTKPDISTGDVDGMFCISVTHEEVSTERVKNIKRAKRAAGWATVAAVSSSVSAAFSRNGLEYYFRQSEARVAAELTDIYRMVAEEWQHLDLIVNIDNLTDTELMVCDMERGLVWYVQPRQTLEVSTQNPNMSQLRISDIHHRRVKYAMVAAGSIVEKKEVAKTDGNWLLVTGIVAQKNGTLRHEYHWANTATYERRRLTKAEFDKQK